MFFEIKEYDITLTVKSGLYIGAGDSAVKIGGVDNEFIKHPISKLPYIPGSSLKGKIRSLLEYDAGILLLREDKISGDVLTINDYENCNGEQKEQIKKVLMLFGAFGSDYNKDIGITRLSFADLELIDEYKQNPADSLEVKAETAIDRKTGTAKDGSLRFTERVGEGVEFTGKITMKQFQGDEKEELEKTLFRGIHLLMKDTLGGAGSRGYGRVAVRFNDAKIQEAFEKYTL